MVESNMNRLIMTIGGVIFVGVIIFFLLGNGSSVDSGSDDESGGFLNNTTEHLIEKNQKRTPKY